MKNRLLPILLSFAAISIVSCRSHYAVTAVSHTRFLIDSRYDDAPDAAATAFLAPYKQHIDSIMSPIVGHSARQLNGYRPESPLSNLLADIMVWAGKDYGEKPVLGVYNIGGIRASLPAGDVTLGDVTDVAPFENKICFLSLMGDRLLQLFSEIAATGGEGVSHGVVLRIANGKLLSATLNGEEIKADSSYRIATINYLAEGNDHLESFKSKTDYVAPSADSNNSRVIIANYFRAMEAEGKTIDAQVEGRIKDLSSNK